MILKSLIKIFVATFFSIFLLVPVININAEEGEVKGDVSVAALVPSKVDKNKSKITVYPTEVLADGVQKSIVTINLKDVNGNSLPNIKVKLISNRGVIDTMREVGTGLETATTGLDGVAYFEVTSSVPGEIILTVTADTLVIFDPLKMTFLALPFPKNVTISVEVPKFISPSGEVKLLRPSGEKTPEEKSENDKIVNLGVNVKIPFWIMLLIVLSLIMNIVLFLLVIIMILKTKKTEEKEEQILEKEKEVLEKISRQKD